MFKFYQKLQLKDSDENDPQNCFPQLGDSLEYVFWHFLTCWWNSAFIMFRILLETQGVLVVSAESLVIL